MSLSFADRYRLLATFSALVFTATVATAELSESEARRNARVDQFLLAAMHAAELDAWIIMTREGNFDPLSDDFGFELGTGALIFLDDGERAARWAVISALDLVPLRESEIYDEIFAFDRDRPFEQVLGQTLERAFKDREIERIGVNTSGTNGIADGLSATFQGLLRTVLGRELASKLVSAETAVLSFRSKKLPEEIEIYRRATAITRDILHETFTSGFVVPGQTTQIQLRDYVHKLAEQRGYPETSWDRESCPGVYSGLISDLSHAKPSTRVIEPGDILYVDFGIRADGLTTDIMRAGYVLRPGESEAPPEVRKMFETAVAANRASVEAIRPGVAGWEIDMAARRVIGQAGYPQFLHAAGHPIGRKVHGAGPHIGPRNPKYGGAADLRLEVGQVFAIEPSVRLPREDEGGSWMLSVEEDVLVTQDGAEYLVSPQTELYLIAPQPAE